MQHIHITEQDKMWLAVLFVWGTLLPLTASEGCPEASEDTSSWLKLKPLGHCKDGENTCPYRITLPPLTIQLPKPFRELEKMARELQSLTQMVNQLKVDCRECKERQRMEWSLKTTGGGEDGERIQASRGTVNTKERQQDLTTGLKAVPGTSPKTKEGTVNTSTGTKQVNLSGMEKQRWNTSQERNLNPSSIRHRDETSGGPKGSNPAHMERRTESMSKVREPQSSSAGERSEGRLPSRPKVKESLSGNQDGKQPTKTSGTRERQKEVPKVDEGTVKKTDKDTMLISSGTKQVNRTNIENQRWNTSRVTNPSSPKHTEESGGRAKASDSFYMEESTDDMSKITDFLTEEAGSPQGEMIVSSLSETQDEEQTTQANRDAVNTRETQQDILKRAEVQGAEEGNTVLIISDTKELNLTGTVNQRWNPSWERNLNQSSTIHRDETSGGPKGSNPAHVERRTESMSKVREPQSSSAGERSEGRLPSRPKVKESLSGNQDGKQPTKTSGTRERQKEVPKVDEGTVKKTDKDTMLISSGTKELNLTGTENQRWNPSWERNLNQSSTIHRDETSGVPKGSNPVHTERSTESNERGLTSQTSEEREKEQHYSKSASKATEHLTKASSDTVNTTERQQDVSTSTKVVPKTEEDTVLISTGTKEGNPTNMDKERRNISRVHNPGGTKHREEASRKPKGSNPTHTDTKAERISNIGELTSLTAEERRKLESSMAEQTEPYTPGKQEEQPTKHKVSTAKAGPGKNTSRTSVASVVSEDGVVESKHLNPPNKDKIIKRFPGFPRLVNANRKEIKLNSSTEGRFENPGVTTKKSSPTGDRTLKGVAERSRFTQSRIRSNEKIPHKADSRELTGSGWITPDIYPVDHDAHRPDIIRSTPSVIDSKVQQPNTDDITEADLDQQSEHEDEVSDTGIRESRPFILGETSNSDETIDSSANMVPYLTSEGKGNKENSNHSTSHTDSTPYTLFLESESDTEVDTKQVEKVSGAEKLHSSISDTGDATTDAKFTDQQINNPASSWEKAESDTGVNSNPVGIISRPGKIRSSISDRTTTDGPYQYLQIWDSENQPSPGTHAESGYGVDSSPLNVVETVTGSEKSRLPISGKTDEITGDSTNPQGLVKNDDLPKGQLKPELNTTRPSSEDIKGSNPIKAKMERKDVLRNNKATTLRTDHVKQTYTARNREDNSPVRGVLKPAAPTADLKVRGRPRPSGPIPTRIKEMNPPVNSTKDKEEVKELNQPNVRKNITRQIPSHVKQPGKNNFTRVILTKNPKLRKPYIWQRMQKNESLSTPLKVFNSERVQNRSAVTEHMLDTERRQVHSKIRISSSGPNKEFKITAKDITQSARPTKETHTIMDHAEKAKTAPPVEVFSSMVNSQIQNTSQSTETKLFHVMEPENPEGKQGLDPITSSVRKQRLETVMNQNIVNHDSNNQNGPDLHQSGTDRQKESKPIIASGVDFNQENRKKLPKVGNVQNSRGKILPTVGKVSTETNELNYPTTAATTFTMKTRIKDKQSQMTQITTPDVTTPHFMTRDHVEKAKSSSGVSHVHHSQSKDIEPESQTRSGSESQNKENNPNLQGTDKDGGSSKGTVLIPKSVKSVSTRAKDSDRTKTSAKGSMPFTDITPHTYEEKSKTELITVDSLEGNNGNRNGKFYPIAVDKTKDMRTREGLLYKTTAKSTIEEDNARPLTINNLEDREDLENQLLSTCHGQCDPRPTPQPILNIRRASENDRDKPPKDCSDLIKKNPKNGVYTISQTGSKNSTFRVFCDMEASGVGWTLIQHRFDGSISFNRTWDDYKRGFGNLTGEFWLGNDKIHWLTSAKAMVLRIELEDLDGIKEYAQYDRFHVANESQHYRLTIGGYSGTAGNAMQFSKKFNHNQKNFTTPDRDNDQYPSGNCGAYYSSGWWFDACMAANLNGKYYQTKYRGVRNGIFWGTWHNISTEYYPTNDRQSFKTVKMMVRPRVTTVRDN